MQPAADDLELFYESINYDLAYPPEKPSPSGTINLKYVFPLSTEVRNKECGSDEAEILFESASGGQKRIYKSRLLSDGRLLALAFMKDSRDLNEIEDFLTEATIARSLKHPNIVEIFDCGIDQKYGPYMVMPWIEGETLHEILKNLRNNVEDYLWQFPLPRLLRYFKEVCLAVDYAHSKDVIHLDLKPENILVNYLTDTASLTDWGLARSFQPIGSGGIDPVMQFQDCPGYLRGTPGYMSPEQIMESQCDQRTDIYQLGALLYAVIFHHCPVDGEDVEEVLEKTLNGEVYVESLNDEIMPYVGICKKSMSIRPEDRYSEVKEVIADLDRIEKHLYLSIQKFAARKQMTVICAMAAVFITVSLVLFYHFIFNTGEQKLDKGGVNSIPELDIITKLKKFVENSPQVVKSPVPEWYLFLETQMDNVMSEESVPPEEEIGRSLESLNSAEDEK